MSTIKMIEILEFLTIMRNSFNFITQTVHFQFFSTWEYQGEYRRFILWKGKWFSFCSFISLSSNKIGKITAGA